MNCQGARNPNVILEMFIYQKPNELDNVKGESMCKDMCYESRVPTSNITYSLFFGVQIQVPLNRCGPYSKASSVSWGRGEEMKIPVIASL